jgi:hypothetical protein
MPSQTERGRCGDCAHFDRNDVNGQPFGEVRLGAGRTGEGGVCRKSRGLVLGMRSPESPCVQPSNVFEQKQVSVDNPPQGDPVSVNVVFATKR